MVLCRCGCGQECKPGKVYVRGHIMVKVKCSQCGKTLLKYPYEIKINKNYFCNVKCKGKWMHENNIGKNSPKYSKIEVKCSWCNKILLKQPHQINDIKNYFCDNICHGKWISKNNVGENNSRYNRIKIKCSFCGKILIRTPSTVSEVGNFCNHNCYAKWLSENRSGENCSQWKGGISQGEYCNMFNLPLKESIRLYFNNKCFMDNKIEKSEHKLSVHHVNYDKRCGCNATQFCIFVPVTRSWNIIFNGSKKYNRWYWYSFLMNKIFIEHPNYFSYHIPVWGNE